MEPSNTTTNTTTLIELFNGKWEQLVQYTKTNPENVLKASLLITVVGTLFGVIFGLCVLGWYVWPVEWDGLGLAHLDTPYKVVLVNVASEWYAYSLNKEKARQFIYNWQGHVLACQMAIQEQDLARKARLISLASTVTGDGCE